MTEQGQLSPQPGEIIVVKIGGAILGTRDSTVEDIVELHRRSFWPVVIHGGGLLISEWLTRHNVPTRFERGLRVTDEESLRVVVAVLAGLVNKQIVAAIQAAGDPAVGLSGADGGMFHCRLAGENLGFVGDIVSVDPGPLARVLLAGVIPVLAPIGVLWEDDRPTAQLLNINADTAAGVIASVLGARWLAFLTDVPGVKSASGEVIPHLTAQEAAGLIADETIQGGMIPKVEACLTAAETGTQSVVLGTDQPGALLTVVAGKPAGTIVGGGT